MMRTRNIFQINDWNIRDFFAVVLAIQASMAGLLALYFLGLDLRNELAFQFLTFLYITFVPGFLIVRILRLHKLGNIRSLLFAMGLSIFTVMMTGVFVNLVLPVAGFSRPITYGNIGAALLVVVSGLSYLCYVRDRDYDDPDYINLKDMCNARTLFLVMLPVASVISVSLMNINGDSTLQMLLLLLIAVIPALIFLGVIGEKYYPLAIFTTSLALLFHTSLFTSYIWGADINHELQLSNMIISASSWDVTTQDNVNAMLSITILSPVYAILMNADVVWVYKIIYPLIFSFVPLGLYYVVRSQTSARMAVFTQFFFMFFFFFYVEMPALARQEIAELFLTLLIVVIVDNVYKKIDRLTILILSVIFGASIIISHYGTAYIYAICIMIAMLIYIFPFFKIDKVFNDRQTNVILNKTYPILLLIFMAAWFTYVAGASLLWAGAVKAYIFAVSLSNLMNPAITQALGIATTSMPLFQSIERYMHLACQLFIIVGIVTTVAYNRFRFAREYYLLAISCLILSIAGFVIPHLSNALNSDRLYHLTLFFMAPFLIVGIVNLADIVSRHRISHRQVYGAIAIFLAIFFLFNSAMIYQAFDQPKLGRFVLDENSDFSVAYPDELSGIGWLKDYYDPNPYNPIYSSAFKIQMFVGFFGYQTPLFVKGVNYKPNPYLNISLNKSYIYMGTYDIKNSEALDHEIGEYLDGRTFNSTIQHQLYDAGRCKIFLSTVKRDLR